MIEPVIEPASIDQRIDTRDPEHRRAERAMGTVISLYLPEGGADGPVADAAFDWFHDVERRFSPFEEDSEVRRLMAGDLRTDDVSDDLAEVLELCDRVEELSDGAFNIRGHRGDGAPDPTGVVKGWSVDRAAEILADAGIQRFTLSAGGDVLVRGGEAPDIPWRIGIAHPDIGDAVALVLHANDLAVATSGTTERGHHIVDPQSGRVADELLTVSVAGPSLARADAYATAAFVRGRAGLRWVDSMPGYVAVGISHERRLIVTRGLDRYRP